MSRTVFQPEPKWAPQQDFEGPFDSLDGQVVYFDPIEEQYYDPETNLYICTEEVTLVLNQLFDNFKK